MKNFEIFLTLTRLNKPIGFMLLFWPCLWGLTIAHDFSENNFIFYKFSLLFFLGAILMRSAGCIVNDVLDRKIDLMVERTKNRPIASGQVSVKTALVLSAMLCLVAFFILTKFNHKTIILGLASMPFAFSYPLMKRFTYWPQLFLGFTFNYGLIMAWVSLNDNLSIYPIVFYLGAIFWTLGYDTVYGFQDIKDDEIIGLKSTSIKFKGTAKLFLILCYFILIISLALGGYFMGFNLFYFLFLIIPLTHLFFYQIKIFNIKKPSTCLKIFKSNNYLGFIILINIFIGKTL